MKKGLKILAIIGAFFLIGLILFVANIFLGNPISSMIVSNNAKTYIEENFSETDYEVEDVRYSFKILGYWVDVVSPSSEDSYFSIEYDMLGTMIYSLHPAYVEGRFNTWNRVNMEYSNEVSSLLFGFSDYDEAIYGEIRTENPDAVIDFGMKMEDLELDKNYDFKEFGAEYGSIILYIGYDGVSNDKVAEILLELKSVIDKSDISCYAVTLRIADINNYENYIYIEDFLYSDIYEEGIEERIENSVEKTNAKIEEVYSVK